MRLAGRPAAIWICGAVLSTLLLGACGGGSNQTTNSKAPATTGTTRASTTGSPAAAGSPTAGCVAIPRPTEVDAQTAQTAQALIPAVLQLSDLPAGLHDFTAGYPAPQPVTNEAYAYGQKDASCIVARLQKDNRAGGVLQVYGKQYTFVPGLQTTIRVQVDISRFGDATAAHDGLTLVFQNTQQGTQTTASQQASVAPLAFGNVGDESQAFRGEQVFSAQVTVNGKPQVGEGRQITYTVGWRRGAVVTVLTLTAVGQDPSLDDLKALVARQDAELQQIP